MANPAGVLAIRVHDEMADVQELAALTSLLREEMLQLDIDWVQLPSLGDAPPGSKGLGIPDVGTLLVHLLESSAMLTAVMGILQSWLSRRPGRKIRLTMDGDELEVTDISAEDQARLMDAWIARHARA